MSDFERTGWRDEEISRRHRVWGVNCPACDIDLPLVEYNLGLPAALIEYKHCMAKKPDLRHPTYRALWDLADGYKKDPLPFLIATYQPDIWSFRVTPVNNAAFRYFDFNEQVTEREFVRRLYEMRKYVLDKHLWRRLNDTLPEDEEDT